MAISSFFYSIWFVCNWIGIADIYLAIATASLLGKQIKVLLMQLLHILAILRTSNYILFSQLMPYVSYPVLDNCKLAAAVFEK